MNDAIYLTLGTTAMVLMMFTIIVFIYLFQRKLAVKAKAYLEIEKLMQQQELQSAYTLLEGQELERQRIAAELHDNIGGLLATLKIYSDLTIEKSGMDDVQRLNLKINTISENLSQEVRKLSHQLDLKALSGFGLKVAVEHLAEAISDSGKLTVLAVIDVQRPINETVSLNLYRIVQELFTNTLKHAMATQSRIEITLIDQDITLIYEDNGKGFDSEKLSLTGMGQKNILSRVNLIGGKLTIDSSARGTTYIIELTSVYE
jgi:two-component system NarL family sensor kinase